MNTQLPTTKGRRIPRADFERSFERIIRNVEESTTHVVKWRRSYNPGLLRETIIEVQAIWSVGSFARGATSCGDLDLLVKVAVIDGRVPLYKTVTSQVFGRHPDVEFFFGTPESNSSGVSFEDHAVLLWSVDNPDWKSALQGIRVNENVGRFIRKHDVLPLRAKQFYYDGELDDLAQLHEKQVISWEWVPLENIPPLDEGLDGVKDFCKAVCVSRGKKSTETFKMAISWFSRLTPNWSWRNWRRNQSLIKMGGCDIYTGVCPPLNLGRLDSIKCSALVIFPHISRRGPNGMWIITRGKEHPLQKKFRSLETNLILEPSARTDFYDWCWTFQRSGVKLYKDLKENSAAKTVSGGDLLDLMACVNLVRIGRKYFEYSPWGMHPSSEKEVVKALERHCRIIE